MMISASPNHGRLLRAFVLACLNLDDRSEAISPVPFSARTVLWSPSDYPRPDRLYCLLSEVSHTAIGPTETVEYIEDDDGETVLRQAHREISDWTVQVQVVSILDDADPALEDSAGVLLRRVVMRLESELAESMRAAGCAYRRRGPMLPLPRLRGTSQWETRAGIDLTFAVGSVIVSTPGWVESVEATGTLAGGRAGDLTETINAAHDDDLGDLP